MPSNFAIRSWISELPSPQREGDATAERPAKRRNPLGEVASNTAGRAHSEEGTRKKARLMDTAGSQGVRRRGSGNRGRGGDAPGKRRTSPRRVAADAAEVKRVNEEGSDSGHGQLSPQTIWEDNVPDAEATPRAPHQETSRHIFHRRPHLPPPSSEWASALTAGRTSPTPASRTQSSGRTSTTDSHRSKSPSRTAADLLPAGIEFTSIEDIPADITQLYAQLLNLSDGDGVMPASVEAEVRRQCPTRKIRSSMFQTIEPNTHDSLELEEIVRIQQAAKRYQSLEAPEAEWNVRIHGPILALALRRRPMVDYHVVTSATLCQAFLPTSHSTGQAQSARIVDFTLNLQPDEMSKSAIIDLVNREPAELCTVNQSMCSTLRYEPCTTAIETKTSTNATDGRVQLAMWSCAQFIRLRRLFELGVGGRRDREGEYSSITLPLLRSAGHYWYFLFAVEQPPATAMQPSNQPSPRHLQRYQILSEVSIGHTGDLVGLYTLLEALRAIADWSVEVYEPWFRRVILGL
jgi:hypothetical protein